MLCLSWSTLIYGNETRSRTKIKLWKMLQPVNWSKYQVRFLARIPADVNFSSHSKESYECIHSQEYYVINKWEMVSD